MNYTWNVSKMKYSGSTVSSNKCRQVGKITRKTQPLFSFQTTKMAVSGAINLYLNYLRIDTINVVVKMTSIENRAADSLRQHIRF